MTCTNMQQLRKYFSEDFEPVDEVNDAVLASSLAALPFPTGAGVGRWSHIIEHDQHTVVDGITGIEVEDGVLHISTELTVKVSLLQSSPVTDTSSRVGQPFSTSITFYLLDCYGDGYQGNEGQ